MGPMKLWIARSVRWKPRILLLLFGLLCALGLSEDARAQGQNYDLSSMPADTKVPLITDSKTGVVQGIYANTAKGKIVAVSGGFVGPVGAGIFMASSKSPLPASPCAFFLRRDRVSPALAELPLACTAQDVWYDATVIEDASVLSPEGKPANYGVARPKSGAVKLIEVSSKSMKEKKRFAAAQAGSIANGRMSLAELGDVQVLFISRLGSAMPYLVISPDQLRKLASALAPADSAELLGKISQ
jgi:hypothetical protein